MDGKKLMADLKMVYAAPDEAAALEELESFGEKWNSKYPKIYKSWSERWATLSTYFEYPADRAENQNLVSALSITINKILCQFFEFTQNLKQSQLKSCLFLSPAVPAYPVLLPLPAQPERH